MAAIPDDELDIKLNGKSPEFMTQGWHGHIATDTFMTPGKIIDGDNCRVPEFGDGEEAY